MPDLKPCPFCGGEASGIRSGWAPPEGNDMAECESCGASEPLEIWNTRPAPELPDGYRVNAHGDLCQGASFVASRYGDEAVTIGEDDCVILQESDIQALAIWLQRRAR